MSQADLDRLIRKQRMLEARGFNRWVAARTAAAQSNWEDGKPTLRFGDRLRELPQRDTE